MPLSKKRQAEYMKNYRKALYLKGDSVIPNLDPKDDPRFNLLLRGQVPLPNCPDGRYRE